jgi:antitoxin (DNA-binding transcriptional repressor) of toxin-antitoxin stability system
VDDNAELADLAEHASQVEARLADGQRIAVTNRGKLLGYLVPAGTSSSPFERLVAAGQVRLATGNLLDHLDPEPAAPGEAEPLGDLVVRMRDEERY